MASTFALGSLSDPSNYSEPIALGDIEPEPYVAALERMVLIRLVEERIAVAVTAGQVRCPCHLAIGQEACAVGVARHLRPTDRVFGAHRSHGHYLALGGEPRALFAEVLGRMTGASRGMGGSMHLIDKANGLYGTVPIVAATIPIAVGAALAAKMDRRGDIAVSFFGDGATEEGVFHESMNLAAIADLPVLFACENNFFASHLHISLRQPRDSVARYAEAHGVQWDRVDGNDVAAVSDAVATAVADMRGNPRPHFIELITYRWKGHVGARDDDDVGVKRKDDLAAWRARDPIRRLESTLLACNAVHEEALESMRRRIATRIEQWWAEAEASPFPPLEALEEWVYCHGATEGMPE
jgi:TPP-dependent pyruvate/acetoin dehydrogenase alpha subunit